MESFFRSLKSKQVYLACQLPGRKPDLFDYIRFYNHRNRHATLSYLSPIECKR